MSILSYYLLLSANVITNDCLIRGFPNLKPYLFPDFQICGWPMLANDSSSIVYLLAFTISKYEYDIIGPKSQLGNKGINVSFNNIEHWCEVVLNPQWGDGLNDLFSRACAGAFFYAIKFQSVVVWRWLMPTCHHSPYYQKNFSSHQWCRASGEWVFLWGRF